LKVKSVEYGRTISQDFHNVSYSVHLELDNGESENEGFQIAKRIVDDRLKEMLEAQSQILAYMRERNNALHAENQELAKKKMELSRAVAKLQGFKDLMEGMKEVAQE